MNVKPEKVGVRLMYSDTCIENILISPEKLH